MPSQGFFSSSVLSQTWGISSVISINYILPYCLILPMGSVLLCFTQSNKILWPKITWGRVYLAYMFQVTHSPFREVKAETWGWNWSRSHERIMLNGLLLTPCLACFPIQPTTGPDMTPASMTCTPPNTHGTSIKKMPPTDSSTHQNDGGFLNWHPLFPDDLSLCQVDKSLTRTDFSVWGQREFSLA